MNANTFKLTIESTHQQKQRHLKNRHKKRTHQPRVQTPKSIVTYQRHLSQRKRHAVKKFKTTQALYHTMHCHPEQPDATYHNKLWLDDLIEPDEGSLNMTMNMLYKLNMCD